MKKVQLRGYFLSVAVPTESYFMRDVDCSRLPGPTYLQLVTQLQDLLSGIDETHRENTNNFAPSRRSLRARYLKVTNTDRRKILSFFVIPTPLVSKIKNIRAKVYNTVRKYSIVIEQIRMGYHRDNIYIVPPEYADDLLAEIEQYNRMLKSLVEEAKKFDITPIEALLSRYDLELQKKNTDIPEIRVELMPIAFSTYETDSSRVQELLRKREEELVNQVLEELKKRLEPAIKAITEQTEKLATRKSYNSLMKGLERIKRMADDIGLHEFSSAVIDPLIEALDNPDKALEIKSNPEGWIDGRIKSLF